MVDSHQVESDLADRRRLRTLATTGLGATSDPAFERFARMVSRLLDVPAALVSLVDDHRQFFPGAVGLDEPWSTERETPLSHSMCQHVVTSGQPLVVTNATDDVMLCDSLAIPELGVIAYAGMPLTDAEGQVLGSLCALDVKPRQWSDDELRTLEDLAAACSSELRLRIVAHDAIGARQGAEVAQSSAEQARTITGRLNLRLEHLADVTRALASTLDVGEALERLTRLMVPTMADWCVVNLLDEHGHIGEVVGLHRDETRRAALDRFVAAEPRVLTARSNTWQVLHSGQPVLRPHVDAAYVAARSSGDDLVDATTALGLSSVVVVPLRSRRRTIGSLLLANGPGSPAFDEEALAAAVDVGIRAGLAIDNARLYSRQRHNSETFQRALLTMLPQPDHVHLAARYQPAAQEAQVGGDWYDAFQQPDGATWLVIGDVTGHDTDAAAAMAQLRTLVRGTAFDRQESPAAVARRVDRSLVGLQMETFATAVLARVEQSAEERAAGLRRLVWANAGHPPPLLLHPRDGVRSLEQDSDLLLGLDPHSPRLDHEVLLSPDSTLLFYTDGLVERRDSPLDHGLARLRQTVSGLLDATPDELCDEVLARMLPAVNEDDVAVLAVRFGTEAGPPLVG
ncbi:MAG: GAF domain-containing SpoIIE family protein phosphatase [Actinomycetes bacterium]